MHKELNRLLSEWLTEPMLIAVLPVLARPIFPEATAQDSIAACVNSELSSGPLTRLQNAGEGYNDTLLEAVCSIICILVPHTKQFVIH